MIWGGGGRGVSRKGSRRGGGIGEGVSDWDGAAWGRKSKGAGGK
jgi:hypothetical protein